MGNKNRRSIRLKKWDYCQDGFYFITICTANHKYLFGEIINGEMQLNAMGLVVEKYWQIIPAHFYHVDLDVFTIMPNHIHGLIIMGVGKALRAHKQTEQFGRPVAGSISSIIRSFKSAVTKCINEMRQTPGNKLWQRNYYEHVIRNEDELSRAREYIVENPLKWDIDKENISNLNGG